MSEGIKRTNTFVSKKISCVRWRPAAQHILTHCSQFISGSWDDEENSLQLWNWPAGGDDPQCLHQVNCQHDITCLTYVSPDVFAAASAGGDVRLYRHVTNRLEPIRHWEKLHSTKCGPSPCTWLSAFDEELVTVGDDGRMNVLNISARQPSRVIDAADTCSLYRVQHISHSHVVTSNMRGQIKSWDLRSTEDSPTSSVMASQQQSPVTSLARHPTQYHVLASGDGDGVICIWDLREARYPVTELKSHSSEVRTVCSRRRRTVLSASGTSAPPPRRPSTAACTAAKSRPPACRRPGWRWTPRSGTWTCCRCCRSARSRSTRWTPSRTAWCAAATTRCCTASASWPCDVASPGATSGRRHIHGRKESLGRLEGS